MANIKQNGDGTLSIVSESSGKGLIRVGGVLSPPAGQVGYPASTTARVPLIYASQIITAGFTGTLGSFSEPSGDAIMVTRLAVRLAQTQVLSMNLTAGTALNAGVVGNNLLDTLNLQSVASNVFDNITNHGANGLTTAVVPAGSVISFTPSGALVITGNLLGYADIEYSKI